MSNKISRFKNKVTSPLDEPNGLTDLRGRKQKNWKGTVVLRARAMKIKTALAAPARARLQPHAHFSYEYRRPAAPA